MGDVAALVVFVFLTGLSYFVWRRLEMQLGKWLFPWLRPFIEKICPVFKMTPWLYEPVEGSDIPQQQKRFFETHTPAFLARRFTPLGDYVLRRDREPSCSRYFLSPDGTVIGSLTCYLGSQSIDCMSVLLSGMYLETSTTNCPNPPPKQHGLQFFILQSQDVCQVIDHHLACMAKAAAEANTQPAPLTADDVKAVSTYGRELSLRSLFKQGVLPELPQFLRLKQPAGAAAAV